MGHSQSTNIRHQLFHLDHHKHHHRHHQDHRKLHHDLVPDRHNICEAEVERMLSVLALTKLSKVVNRRDKQGMSLLHRTCEQGLCEITHLLLELGANPSLTSLSNHGNTNALILAASGGHVDCLRWLLSFGADAQLADSWGNTALFKAACYNHVDCVEELLRNGADPDAANKWGALPIQYAALEGHHQVVSALIRAGADVTAPGEVSKPQTIDGALIRGHFLCFAQLLDRAIDCCPDSICALRLLDSLLNRLITVPDNVISGHVLMAELLLQRGAVAEPDTLRTLADRVQHGVESSTEYSLVQSVLLSLAPDHAHCESFPDLFRTLSRIGKYSRRCVDLILNIGY